MGKAAEDAYPDAAHKYSVHGEAREALLGTPGKPLNNIGSFT